MDYEYIVLEKEDEIVTITLNRPEKLNALIPPMRMEMRKALEDVGNDERIRVLILTGAGRAFSAGADIATVAEQALTAEDETRRGLLLQPVSSSRLVALIQSLNKPTICALNGVVAGSSIALALSCDIVIASEQAKFRIAFTRMGLSLDHGLSYLLPRIIGPHLTLELAYTNDMIDAREMERIGLANRVVPHDNLMKSANEMAEKMLQIPPITLALTKKCVYKGIATSDIDSQMSFEMLLSKTLEQTEDQKEAKRSFLEKRKPVYMGK